MAGFKRDELIYRGLPIFARTDSPYWLSPVELSVSVVYTALKADEWNRTWLTDGNTPDWWMKMPDTMSPDQIIEWLDLFDTMLAGNSAQRHKVKVTPGEPRAGNARKEADFALFETWLMQRTCSVMGVNPASVGHHSDTYKDSQEIALKSTKDGRIAQLLAFRRSHYNELLERKGLFEVEVQDEVYDAEDAKARAERHQVELSSGQRTLNETRKEDGLQPYKHPLADVPLVTGGVMSLEGLQPDSSDSVQMGNGSDAVMRALRQFEKKALNRLRENADAECPFTVVRYDSNQPRDGRGRWTSGGSNESHLEPSREPGPAEYHSSTEQPATTKIESDREATRFPSEHVSTETQRKACENNRALYTSALRPAGGELASVYRDAERVRGEFSRLAQKKKDIESRHFAKLESIKEREAEIRRRLEDSREVGHAWAPPSVSSLSSQLDYELGPVEREARALLHQPHNPSHFRPRVTHAARWNTAEFERYNAAMDEFERLVAASVRPGLVIRTQRSLEKEGRSKWVQSRRTMYLRKGAPLKTAVHEAAHALERNNDDVFLAAMAFHRRRTLGENSGRIRDMVQGNYREDEVAKRDRYPREYMGKEYPPEDGKVVHCEILSVGLEMMVENPAAFAREDPERFDFIYSVLRNPAAARAHQEELLRRAEAKAHEM